ncbi:hypothetical protein [Asaia sp. As-1742]|uniref:hypothetical protein n=1 Tax=Asaia sp. As-1742 TaxID=2608325 RepID=UPI00141EC650|nr:hypothetical protein [Asaia sp. As-1742]NIE79329.1 hypothetical protein [Asaia sp. As-1742]
MTLMRKHWFYPYIVMSYIAVFLWLSGFQNSPVKAAHQTLIGATWIGTLVLACWVCDRPPTLMRGLVRSLALGGSGLWIARHTLPGFDEGATPHIGWVRFISVGLAVLCESIVLIAAMRLVFGKTGDPDKLNDLGLPPLVVRAMLAEARFWRRVWHALTVPR